MPQCSGTFSSITCGAAVLALLGGGGVPPGDRIAPDGLISAVVAHRLGFDPVAAALEFIDDYRRQTILEMEHAAVVHHGPGWLTRSSVVEARGVTGLLEIHAQVEQIDQHLDVPLGLH